MISHDDLERIILLWGSPGVPCVLLDGHFGLLIIYDMKPRSLIGVQVPNEPEHRWRSLEDFRLCGGPIGTMIKLPIEEELIRQFAQGGNDYVQKRSSNQYLVEIRR